MAAADLHCCGLIVCSCVYVAVVALLLNEAIPVEWQYVLGIGSLTLVTSSKVSKCSDASSRPDTRMYRPELILPARFEATGTRLVLFELYLRQPVSETDATICEHMCMQAPRG